MLVLLSPKFQDQAVGLFVELSVKLTVWPVKGALGEEVKPAVGATTVALTVNVLLVVLDPPALPATSVTV